MPVAYYEKKASVQQVSRAAEVHGKRLYLGIRQSINQSSTGLDIRSAKSLLT